MITDILVDHPWMSPTALALLVVLGPLLGAWLVPRPRLAWILAGVALLPVLALTLVPVDRRIEDRCVVQWSLPTPGRAELAANVVLFVAPVLLAGVATRRPLLTFLGATVLSIGLEGVQALATGIGRSCDTTDWLSNTIGAAIGAVLAMAALWIARRGSVPRRGTLRR